MTHVEQLSAFIARVSYADLSPAAVEQLKIRILDSLGCAIGALDGEPVRLIRAHVEEFGGAPRCTLIGGGAIKIQNASALGATNGGTAVTNGAALHVEGGIIFALERLTFSA